MKFGGRGGRVKNLIQRIFETDRKTTTDGTDRQTDRLPDATKRSSFYTYAYRNPKQYDKGRGSFGTCYKKRTSLHFLSLKVVT